MKVQIKKNLTDAKDDPTVKFGKALHVVTDPDSGKMVFHVTETTTTQFDDFGDAEEFFDNVGQS